MSKTVYIVRHGETEYNRLGIVQGAGVDASLNDTGRLQAQAFYQHYQQTGFELVITSTLRRTHETVAPFIDAGLPWEQFGEINEICWGKHEGQKSTPDMHAQYKAVVEAWESGNLQASLEGAEGAADLQERLGNFVQHLNQRPEERILICSHGRAMRALLCLLKEQHLRLMNNYKHDNTGLYKANYREATYHFLLENDTTHLSQLDLKIG
jgi:broad specificity phosphatase PhoE